MKKLFFAASVVLSTFVFAACDTKPANDANETVIDTDTTEIEVERTTVETDIDTNTTTREIEVDSADN